MCRWNPCCSISASIFTIVQCTLHMVGCVWMILVNVCTVSMVDKNYLETFWYFTYFYRNTCTASNISSIIDTDLTIDDFYTLPVTSSKTEMTYSFAIAFTVLDIVWIISSLGLIVGMCISASGWKYKVFHLQWLVCCFGICAFDVVATVIYGYHATETNTLQKWFQFLGAEEIPDVDISDFYDTSTFTESYLILPSIVMAVFFSRLVIIWFINVIFFLSLLCSVCNSHPNRNGRVHSTPPIRYNIPQGNDTPRIPPSHTTEEAEVQQGNVYSRVYPENNLANDFFKKPLPTMNSKTTTEDSNSNEARIKRWQLYYGSDAFDLRVKQPRPSNTNPPAPQKLGPGYNTMQPEERSEYGEGALRSQLPWSYFQKRTDTGRPRPTSPEVMPPVPVPDYNINFEGHSEHRKKL